MDAEQDAYGLLGVGPESTVEQIRKAYRQTSLKVHPDKNPDPAAASLFHALTTAYALLLDPPKRAALDTSLRAKQARALQLAAASGKKRAMLEELERAEERAAKRSRGGEEEARRHREEAEIKDAGRRMREERASALEQQARKREAAAALAKANGTDDPLGPTDLTLLLRLPNPPPSPSSLSATLAQFGPFDPASLLIRPAKPPKPAKDPAKEGKEKEKKKEKGGTAVVQFLTKQAALRALGASGRQDLGMGGVRVDWAAGEPAWVAQALAMPPLQTPDQPTVPSTTLPSFDIPSLVPPAAATGGFDYESITLARMRKAERERLEQEIRAHERGGGEVGAGKEEAVGVRSEQASASVALAGLHVLGTH